MKENKIKLICLPYGGGVSSWCIGWKKYLQDGIELVSLEMAGRWRRHMEKPYSSLEDATKDLCRKIHLEDQKYAIIGHVLIN